MSNQKKIYVADEAEKASKSNYIKEHDPQELAEKIVDAGSAKLKATEGMTATEMIGSGQAPADSVVDKVLDAGAKALEQQEREENGMTTKGGMAAAAMSVAGKKHADLNDLPEEVKIVRKQLAGGPGAGTILDKERHQTNESDEPRPAEDPDAGKEIPVTLQHFAMAGTPDSARI